MRINRLLLAACGIFLSATTLCAQVKPLQLPGAAQGKSPASAPTAAL